MRYWVASLSCFLPLAALGLCPPALRFHLPFICAVAWTAWAGLLLLPRRQGFPRLFLSILFAYCWLGIPRLPWRHAWDGTSYWIGMAAFPLFAAGLHRFVRFLLGEDAAGRTAFALLAVYFFPVKLVFRLCGLELPPTPVASPLVLVTLVAGSVLLWRIRPGRPAGPGGGP